MTIQQFANEEFDEQKVERHEVRQVLRGVRQLTPEAWVEARRQRAEVRTEQAGQSTSVLPEATRYAGIVYRLVSGQRAHWYGAGRWHEGG